MMDLVDWCSERGGREISFLCNWGEPGDLLGYGDARIDPNGCCTCDSLDGFGLCFHSAWSIHGGCLSGSL